MTNVVDLITARRWAIVVLATFTVWIAGTLVWVIIGTADATRPAAVIAALWLTLFFVAAHKTRKASETEPPRTLVQPATILVLTVLIGPLLVPTKWMLGGVMMGTTIGLIPTIWFLIDTLILRHHIRDVELYRMIQEEQR